MSNEQLVVLIKAGEDVARNMEALYLQVKGFIHTIAWEYRGAGELEDLEQEGYLALYPAIDGYDPERGVKFLTYAENWIRQRIRRYVQDKGGCLRLPVYRQDSVRKYQRFKSDFMMSRGREPSDVEIRYYLELTQEQVEEIRGDIQKSRLGSLDSPVAGLDGGEDITVGDLVAAPGSVEDDVLEERQREELKRELWDCVDSLPDRQGEVLRMRYQKDMSLSMIGREYGTTPEAVRQIHAKALRELRKPRNSKRLRPFLPGEDNIYSAALTGNGVSRFNQTWTSSTERVALELVEEGAKRRFPENQGEKH